MPEQSGGIHPGSWIGDSVEEFKKLPTWGKVAAVGVLVVVVFLAIRARSAKSTAQQAAASTAGTNPLGTAGAATTGTQSAFPMVGNLPVLPNNVNPIFDSAGNPIAFQQGPAPTVPGGAPPPTPKPINTPTPPTPIKLFPGGSPGGPPVQKPVRTVATLVNNPMNSSASTQPHISSAVTPYRVQGVSPAPARVAAQRVDIQQLRTEQAANTGANFAPPARSAKPVIGPY